MFFQFGSHSVLSAAHLLFVVDEYVGLAVSELKILIVYLQHRNKLLAHRNAALVHVEQHHLWFKN